MHANLLVILIDNYVNNYLSRKYENFFIYTCTLSELRNIKNLCHNKILVKYGKRINQRLTCNINVSLPPKVYCFSKFIINFFLFFACSVSCYDENNIFVSFL